MKSNKKHFFLFFDHNCQFFFFFAQDQLHLLILRVTLSSMQILHFLFELFDSHNVPFNFMFNNPDGGISDLVSQEELVKLSEIRVCLEDVQKVESQLE